MHKEWGSCFGEEKTLEVGNGKVELRGLSYCLSLLIQRHNQLGRQLVHDLFIEYGGIGLWDNRIF